MSCACRSLCAPCVCRYLWRSEDSEFSGSGVEGVCKPSDTGAGPLQEWHVPLMHLSRPRQRDAIFQDPVVGKAQLGGPSIFYA